MSNSLGQETTKEANGTFQSIVEAINRTMNLPVCIWVLDELKKVLKIKAAVGLRSGYVKDAFLALDEPSVTGEALASGKVVSVRDILSDPRWKYKDEAREMGWKSALCVPIQVHGVIIGVLSIYTFVIRDFSDLEKQLLTDYATQIGLALEAERRKKTFKRLLDIGDDFTQLITREPKGVLQEITKGACEVTGADCAVIYPYDATREEFYDIDLVAHHGLYHPLDLKDRPRKKGMGAYVVREGELVRSDIEQEDPDMLKSPFISREGIKAFMGIALKVAGRVLGILYVDFRAPHRFGDEEKDTIRLFAHQAALAIDNSRLYQQATTRAEALKKLHEVGPALVSIAGAPGGLETTLTQIAQNAQTVLGADLVDLYQYIQSRNEYILPPIQVGERYDSTVRKDRIYEDDVICSIVKNKKPSYFPEAQSEPTLTQPYTVVRPDAPEKRFVEREDVKSTAIVPLIAGTEVMGVLFASYRSPQIFPQLQRELIEMFASQAAIAIRNARLFEQRRALQEIGRDITRTLDKDDLLQKILKSSLELLGCEIGSIALLNKTTNQLEFQYAVGKERYLSVPFGKGLIGTAAETRKPVRVGDVTKDSRYIEHVAATRSELDVPMLIGEELVGVLNLESTRFDAFDEDSEELAVILANQAAVALYNVGLFERRSALAEFGREVTSGVRLREDEVLELIHRQASKLMDTGNMYIALYDPDPNQPDSYSPEDPEQSKIYGTVRFGLAFMDGVRIDVDTDERWKPRKEGKGKTEEIIRTRKSLFQPTRAEAGAWYHQEGHKEYIGKTYGSWLGVPMMVGEKVLGVIATYNPGQDYVYNKDDLEILQALANQAAIAIENARLYQEVRGEAIATKQLATLGTAMAALQHRINNTFNIIVPNVMRLRQRVDPADDTIAEILDIIERNARYTSDIISRIQKPLGEIESQDVNINAVLNEAVSRVREQWQTDAVRRTIDVKMDLNDSIPQIRAPIGQIAEVFYNLVDNAYRAMKGGGRLKVASLLEDRTIRVRVQDTGPGIPPPIRKRLFVKPVPSKDPGGGAGLGLWLSSLMLQSLGGRVIIEKSDPAGTTMLVEIPVP